MTVRPNQYMRAAIAAGGVLAIVILPVRVDAFTLTRLGWGGYLGYEYHRGILNAERIGTRESESFGLSTQLGGYIYQPWLAQFSLSGTYDWSHSRASNSSFDSVTDQDVINGLAKFDLFPASRFPFKASVSIVDRSRESDGLIGEVTDTTIVQTYGLRQEYRPLSGTYKSYFTYQRELAGSDSAPKSESQSAVFNINYSGGAIVTAKWDSSEPGMTDAVFETSSLAYSQFFALSDFWGVATSAEISRSEADTGSSQNTVTTIQTAGADFEYRRRHSNFAASSNNEVLNLETESQLQSVQLASFDSLNTASYRFSDNLSGQATVDLRANEFDNQKTEQLAESLSLNYRGDSTLYGSLQYDWSTSGSLRNRGSYTEDGSENVQSANEGFQHSVRTTSQDERGTTSIDIGQSLFSAQFSDEDTSYGVNHSVSWNRLLMVERGTANITTALTDSRNVQGDNRSEVQNLTVVGTRVHPSSAASVWNFSATGQLSRSTRSDDVQNEQLNNAVTWVSVLSGRAGYNTKITRFQRWENSASLVYSTFDNGISERDDDTYLDINSEYSDARLFGIDNLQLSSSLELSQQSDAGENMRWHWLNQLDWSIGKLTTSSSLKFDGGTESETQGLFSFSVKRRF